MDNTAANDGSKSAPFFVVGAQRSGTTMLRLMLNAHPRLAVPFESGFIPRFYRQLGQYGDLSIEHNRTRLLEDIGRERHVVRGGLLVDRQAILSRAGHTYADLVRAIFEVYAASRGKPRWGDKTPGYGSSLEVICGLFPECKVVHVVRDGRDVALSNRRVSWGIPSMPKIASMWRWETILTRKLGYMIGSRYLELKYEDLVVEPARELRRICRHIEEEFDDRMLRYFESATSELPSDSLQWHRSSVSAPDESKLFRWRSDLSIADRIIFEEHAGDALEEFGYEREHRRPTIRSRARTLLYAAIGR